MENNSASYMHVLAMTPHSKEEKTHFLYTHENKLNRLDTRRCFLYSERCTAEEQFEDKFRIEYHGPGIYDLEHQILVVYKVDDGLFVIERPFGDINYNPCEYEYDVFRYNDADGLVCKRSCINNECFIDICYKGDNNE